MPRSWRRRAPRWGRCGQGWACGGAKHALARVRFFVSLGAHAALLCCNGAPRSAGAGQVPPGVDKAEEQGATIHASESSHPLAEALHVWHVLQELAEFRQESTELKNQGVTIRRLEERARELEAALAEKARRGWAAVATDDCIP